MARGSETRDVDLAFGEKRLHAAHAYVKQARLSAEAATDSYERASAVSSAVLAAIAAADATCALKLRQVSKGDHAQAHTLLRQVVGAGDAANGLQRLVSQKASVQYLAESVTASKLEAALRQAQIVVDFADRLYRER
ncbi:MAG TPA: hypothetical protein VES02_05455 [Dermatophilaceae bacterium]|nr:hypothetical protein [Dermatophilaceae bacterium]